MSQTCAERGGNIITVVCVKATGILFLLSLIPRRKDFTASFLKAVLMEQGYRDYIWVDK